MPSVYNKRFAGNPSGIPKDAVYVGRPSKWGNPFKIGDGSGHIRRMTREQVMEKYREWITYSDAGRQIAAQAREELRGKDLVCWCAPYACHADVLLEIANAD